MEVTNGRPYEDKDLIDKMKESKTIEDWNSNREFCKKYRDQKWISVNIDSGALIKEVNPKAPDTNSTI